MGGDEIEVSDDESSDLEEYWSDKEEETVQNLKIWNTDITRRLGIYDWDENVPGFMIAVASIMEYEKSQNQSNTIANLLIIRLDVRNGQPVVGEWIVIVWRKNCALGAYHIEYTLLLPRPSNGLISDDESCSYCWRRWKSHEITYHDHDEIENETHDERQELCEAHELRVRNIRGFKMIKYSFGQDKEYVAVKEDEYDDLARTSNEACRAYQEIYRMMDEGWMVTRTE
ncbi:hypothetical protein Tco_0801060 [Tanacetum coccineum]|uniref:Uncharacterized protein n=1 Tax=Tanacetum coccineum TaxID=301880 RepID=A0ABQ4ZZ01_9ASTR